MKYRRVTFKTLLFQEKHEKDNSLWKYTWCSCLKFPVICISADLTHILLAFCSCLLTPASDSCQCGWSEAKTLRQKRNKKNRCLEISKIEAKSQSLFPRVSWSGVGFLNLQKDSNSYPFLSSESLGLKLNFHDRFCLNSSGYCLSDESWQPVLLSQSSRSL